jgi:antitoxin component YwqK of YwqJK toxin-antitoxin module
MYLTVYYKNGKIETIGEYKKFGNELIPFGQHKFFLENGTKKKEVDYLPDNKSKVEKNYFQNGKVQSIVNYFDSLFHGKSIQYNQEGIIENERNFKFGKLNGSVKSYFPNGNLQIESNFCNGQQQGIFIQYYENGKIKLKGFVDSTASLFEDSDLRIFGDLILYNENGSLKQKIYINKDGTVINKPNESNVSNNLNLKFNYINNSKSKCQWCGKFVDGCKKKTQSDIESEKKNLGDFIVLFEPVTQTLIESGISKNELSNEPIDIELYKCPKFCSPKCEYDSKKAGN